MPYWFIGTISLADAVDHGGGYKLSIAQVFILFFVMMGPLKMIAPFASVTRSMPESGLRGFAIKVFLWATVTTMVAGLLGSGVMKNWQIQPAVMQLAGGFIFLLVALRIVLEQYQAPIVHQQAQPPTSMGFVFPAVLTPYGIAALIILMALSTDTSRLLVVLAIAFGVLVINLAAMIWVRPLMHLLGGGALQILGAILGVLQVALALQFMLNALLLIQQSL